MKIVGKVFCWIVVLGLLVWGEFVVMDYIHNPKTSVGREQIIVEKTPLILPKTGNRYGAYLAGFMAKQNQDYNKTIDYYERVLFDDPDNLSVKTDLYLLKAMQGNFTDMVPLAQDIAKNGGAELLAEYVLIAEAVKQGDYVNAQQILNQKKKYGLDYVLKPTVGAWLLAGQGKRKEANQALTSLKTTEDMESFYWYYRALLDIYFEDYVSAEASFEKSVLANDGLHPSLTGVVISRSFFQSLGKWNEQERGYQWVKNSLVKQPAAWDVVSGLSGPEKITPTVGIGVAFYDVSVALGPLNVPETSLVFAEMASYLMPTATIPLIWSGELLESVEAYHLANRAYDRIKNPSDVITLKKAMNLMVVSENKKAMRILEEIALRNPNNPVALTLLAENYVIVGQSDKAIENYLKAIRLFQKTKKTDDLGDVLLALASVYHDKGQIPEAEKMLLEALKTKPNDPMILNYLGYFWLDRGKNTAEAFDMVKQADILLPNEPHILDSLAFGYYIQGDYLTALAYAKRSIDLMPYSAIAYSHLGDIYKAMGRSLEASYQYRKALDMDVDMTPKLRSELQQKLQSETKRPRGLDFKKNL